jgi:hypothetical protein
MFREPTMKTERISVLATPEFKAFLTREAEKEGISVSELVRRRCERLPNEDEAVLLELAAALKEAVAEAKGALRAGLREAAETLAEIEARRREAA